VGIRFCRPAEDFDWREIGLRGVNFGVAVGSFFILSSSRLSQLLWCHGASDCHADDKFANLADVVTLNLVHPIRFTRATSKPPASLKIAEMPDIARTALDTENKSVAGELNMRKEFFKSLH
jgi:hypothetical protein